jgi:hypothetical protein
MDWNPLHIVILIGPYGAGKSTLAELIAQKLGWCRYSLDEEYYHYLPQVDGYTVGLANEMNSWSFVSPRWQPYDIQVVERFLLEHSKPDHRCIVDFGVSHSIYDGGKFARIEQILAPYLVVLILPSPNLEESVAILLKQIRAHGGGGLKGSNLTDEQINASNRYILEHPSNYKLAKITIYTKGKTTQETSKEICQKLQLSTAD